MPDLERIQQNTPGTLSQQWYEDGAAVDPGTVTLGITRADGTTLVAAGAATSGATTSPRTYNLTTTHTALLDRLTVTWTSTLKGTLVSYVEVVGGFLFSIAEARAIKPLDATATYSTASIVAMRTTVEQAMEDACGVAFVPRYTLETVDGPGTADLLLSSPFVRRVRSVSVAGTAWAQATLDALTYRPGGIVYSATAWTAGYGNLQIGYEHGCDFPPERVRRAALLLARTWLVTGPIDDRAATFSSADTGATYSLVTPGRGGSLFGVPEVDVVIQQYGMVGGVA